MSVVVHPFDIYRPAFFSPREFQGWATMMDVTLLVRLDTWRALWGKPIAISSHPRGVGREVEEGKPGYDSQHNYVQWRQVRAVDCIPSGITTADDLRRARDLAIDAGFTGVGVYPHWRPSPGVHVDTRRSNVPGEPALWGAVQPDRDQAQQYVSAEAALDAFTEVPA